MDFIHLRVLIAISLASAMPAPLGPSPGIQLPSPPSSSSSSSSSPPLVPFLPAALAAGAHRHAAAASVCNFHWDVVPAPQESVERCQGYLDDKGNESCAVSGTGADDDGKGYSMTQFCETQDGTRTVVFGVTYKADGTASPCADVARAVEGIITACSVDGQVAGQDAAYGNGDLLVLVQHGYYYNDTQGN